MFLYLKSLENYLQLIVIPLISIILAIKLLNERKETGETNYIRLYILLVFLSFTYLVTIEFIHQELNLLSVEAYGSESNSFSFYNFALAIIGTFALSMVFYANQWESLYYLPFFFFGALIILFIFTGFYAFLMFYIYLTCVISLAFMYYTSFRLKDNGALGIGIFFTIAFMTLFTADVPPLGNILTLIFCGFGLIFALGYFHPFKQGGYEQ